MDHPLRRVLGLPTPGQQRQLVGEADPHPSVGRADGPGADPHDVTGRAQLVEQRRPVVGDPRRQHIDLERRRHDRRTGEQAERLGIALRVPLLEPLRGAPVQLCALLGEQRPVRRLLD